jgi:S1-C subfamily serine protease
MEISNKLWNLKRGDQISCTIAGKGTITLTVEELKSLDGKTLAANRLGLGLEKLTLNLAKALRYPFHGGLLVNNITNRTTKSVRRGEVLVRIDNVPIYEFSDIRRALNDKHYGDAVNAIFISIVHNGAKKFITKRTTILKVQ